MIDIESAHQTCAQKRAPAGAARSLDSTRIDIGDDVVLSGIITDDTRALNLRARWLRFGAAQDSVDPRATRGNQLSHKLLAQRCRGRSCYSIEPWTWAPFWTAVVLLAAVIGAFCSIVS